MLNSLFKFVGELKYSTVVIFGILLFVPIATFYNSQSLTWGIMLALFLIIFYMPLFIIRIKGISEGLTFVLLCIISITVLLFTKWLLLCWFIVMIYAVKTKSKSDAILPNEFI